MKLNPYIAGNIVKGNDFYDREKLLENLYQYNGRHYFVNGIRRMGKSSILKRVQEYYQNKNNTIVIFETFSNQDTTEKIGSKISRTILNYQNENNVTAYKWEHSDKMSISEALNRLISFADKNALKVVLLFDEIGKINSESFMGDELLRITDVLDGFKDKINVFIAGTRKLAGNKVESPEVKKFYSSFELLSVNHFSKEEAIKLIRQTNNSTCVLIDDENRFEEMQSEILNYCGGHPYLIQHVCKNLYCEEKGILKFDNFDVKTTFAPDSFIIDYFKEDLDSFSDLQQNIIKFLAVFENSDSYSIRSKLSHNFNYDNFDSQLNELLNLGVVSSAGGCYKLSTIMFKNWIFENIACKTLYVATAKGQIGYKEELKKHLHTKIQKGLFKIWCENDCPSGDNHQEFVEKGFQNTTIIMFLLTPELIADESVQMFHDKWCKTGKRIIPILVTRSVKFSFKETSFGAYAPLPDGQKTIEDFDSPSDGWAFVANSCSKLIFI